MDALPAITSGKGKRCNVKVGTIHRRAAIILWWGSVLIPCLSYMGRAHAHDAMRLHEDSFVSNYTSLLCNITGDPLWWSDDDISLLDGTNLGIAVELSKESLIQLRHWRDRLCTIHR
jgi:hypothetical protein